FAAEIRQMSDLVHARLYGGVEVRGCRHVGRDSQTCGVCSSDYRWQKSRIEPALKHELRRRGPLFVLVRGPHQDLNKIALRRKYRRPFTFELGFAVDGEIAMVLERFFRKSGKVSLSKKSVLQQPDRMSSRSGDISLPKDNVQLARPADRQRLLCFRTQRQISQDLHIEDPVGEKALDRPPIPFVDASRDAVVVSLRQ